MRKTFFAIFILLNAIIMFFLRKPLFHLLRIILYPFHLFISENRQTTAHQPTIYLGK